MGKHFRKLVYIIIALGTIFIIATVSINYIVKNKIQTFIETRLPGNIVHSYENITVQSFDGSTILNNASVILKNQEDSSKHTFINVEKLKISDISYWDYLFNNEIHIDNILLQNPTIAHYKDRMKPSADTLRNAVAKIYKPIIVDKLQIENAKFVLYERSNDSIKLYTKGLSVEINNLKLDNRTVLRKIPFDYENYKANGDTIFVKVSPYENLTVADFSIKNRNAVFNKLNLQTKYSKKELSRIISRERDHYNLSLDSLSIDGIDLGFNEGIFFSKSKLVSLKNPSLEIYRDKLVPDDPKIKPLYSKMLRDLPIKLTVDSLKIADAKIKYEERVKPENIGGSINFENLQAAISNVGNTYKSPAKTVIKVKSHFMDKTPFSANWSFDVQNTNDHFTFQAEVGTLVADKMNSFTEPNLKVRLEGQATKTYFTIDGNNDTSTTNLKINYSDFKVTILQKDGEKRNWLLSAITNIFISTDSEKKNEYYREGTADATRNKTQSVFNFLWISVKNALTKSLTGKNN